MEKILDYQITESIFKSRNTEIFRAVDKDNRKVILKLLRNEFIDSEKMARFKREYEITKSISSKWVIEPYNFIEFNDSPVIVLEDFDGVSLNEYINKERDYDSNEKLSEALNIAVLLTHALIYIHNQNIIHKDLNPSNIIINEQSKSLKIIDFGIATELLNEQFEPVDEIRFEGNYAYISPEQTGRFNRIIDYRTDFYSLGVTLYELFSGKLPFTAETPREWVHCHIAKEPVELYKVNSKFPKVISDIVMKLLNKTVDFRYQSGFGILKDLEKCQKSLLDKGIIESFKIGEFDVSQKFQIPQKLYGREKEIKKLLDSFRKIKNNQVGCVLVSGYPGIGKTAVIKEIQRSVIEHHGYFISGKFDQLNKSIPFNAFLHAFTNLVKSILSENEGDIKSWKSKILENLNGNAQLIIDAIPELEYIVGKQPVLPVLPPTESHNRFFRTFQNFIQTFTSYDHPLVLFLDNLQWADAASLELVEHLLANQQAGSFLLIGAYRHTEIGKNHPLNHTIKRIEILGINFDDIKIDVLEAASIKKLIIDAFSLNSNDADLLTEFCVSKTNGNPFYILEFLKTLYRNGLLHFNPGSGNWVIDAGKIEKIDVAENVAILISKRINELPEKLKQGLEVASCLGSVFNANLLAGVAKHNWKEIIQLLKSASNEHFVCPLTEKFQYAKYDETIDVSFKFVHDRVQQEIYSAIPEQEKEDIHWNIGKFLLESYNDFEREENLFLVLEHLNKGLKLASDEQRSQIAELNLKACKKAKTAGAFEHALFFIKTSLQLIPDSLWKIDYTLAFQLHYQAAEALSLCGRINEMHDSINSSLEHINELSDIAQLLEIRILSYISQHQQPKAVSEALSVLKLLGISFPEKPGFSHIITSLIDISGKLKKIKSIENLQLPLMTDQKVLTATFIMAKVLSASYYVDRNLFPLIVIKLLKLTLGYGIAPKSSVAFVAYGLLLNALGKVKQGYRFGKIGMEMFNKTRAGEHWAQAACIFYTGSIWIEEIDKSIKGLFKAYKVGIDTGDMEYAVASAAAGLSYKFHSGKNLKELHNEAEKFKRTLSYIKQKVPTSQIDVILQTVQNFININDVPEVLNGEYNNENEMLEHYLQIKDSASAFNLYLNKLMLAFYFKRYSQAYKIIKKARKIEKNVAGTLLIVKFYFYESLTLSIHFNDFKATDRKIARKRLKRSLRKFKKWSKINPSNFSNKYFLVAAEFEKLKGNNGLAGDYYHKSSILAGKEGFINEQALANELSGRFWLSVNKEDFAQMHIYKAYKLYGMWGAKAKALALIDEFDDLISSANSLDIASTTGSQTLSVTGSSKANQVLDMETVLDISKTISGEIVLNNLIKKALTLILEHAGAHKGILLLKDDEGQMKIEAFGAIADNEINVVPGREKLSATIIPKSVILYVKRTKETVILHNAWKEGAFIHDTYFRNKKTKSAIAIPILHQSKLSGILYLENNLSSYVFNQKNVDVLTIICNQTAVSMENAMLFNSMEQKVTDRTKEISEKNKLLREQKEKLEVAHNQLTELNATKDKFFSIIAHDLRGPVGNINALLDLLAKRIDKYDREELIKFIERLSSTSEKTYELLNHLLVWAQTQRNEIRFEPEKQSINWIIEKNIVLVEQKAQSKKVVIVNKINSEVTAFFDSDLVDSIIRNLITNALKYVNENGSIIITSSENSDEIIISVEDTGIGMNEKTKNSLFQIGGKQSSRAGTKGERGTGLGLVLCKEFITINKGKIWVESELGKGSIFSFSLPKIK